MISKLNLTFSAPSETLIPFGGFLILCRGSQLLDNSCDVLKIPGLCSSGRDLMIISYNFCSVGLKNAAEVLKTATELNLFQLRIGSQHRGGTFHT